LGTLQLLEPLSHLEIGVYLNAEKFPEIKKEIAAIEHPVLT